MIKKSGDSHQNSVKNYFSGIAQRWNDLYFKVDTVSDLILLNRKDFAVSFLGKYLSPNSKVFDVGCGAGIVALDVVKKDFFVCGVDTSEEMIELCKKNFLKNNISRSAYIFKSCNFFDSGFPDNYFDGILALGLLEYQEDERMAADYFKKILRPGGFLICSGPLKIRISNLFGMGLLLDTIYTAIKKHKSISINTYTLSRFKNILETSGFKVIDFKRHGYAHFLAIHRLLGFKGEFFLHRLFTNAAQILPIDYFANDIIVVAKKNKTFNDVSH